MLDADGFEVERAVPRARRPGRWLLAPTLHALLPVQFHDEAVARFQLAGEARIPN